MIGRAALTLTALVAGCILPARLPAQDPLPTLTLDPVLTIPGEGDGYYLSSVVDVLPAPDGTLVVREGVPEIGFKQFGADGRFLRRIGREGEGPGEYRLIQWSGFLGDTLWVVDPRLRRVTRWLEGELLGTQSWGDSALVTMPVALLDDGTIVTAFEVGPLRWQPLIRERDGALVAELPAIRTDSTNVTRNVGLPTDGRFFNPFAATSLRAVAPDGSGAAWVERQRARSDTTSSYRVVLWRDGHVTERRFLYEPTPLAHREKDWWGQVVDAYATQIGPRIGVSRLEMTRAFEEAFPEPRFALPVYEALLDDEGRVWLAVHSTPGALTWVRLSRELEPEARVVVPVAEEVMAVACGRLITRWKDGWDVPEVRVYRVVEGPGR